MNAERRPLMMVEIPVERADDGEVHGTVSKSDCQSDENGIVLPGKPTRSGSIGYLNKDVTATRRYRV